MTPDGGSARRPGDISVINQRTPADTPPAAAGARPHDGAHPTDHGVTSAARDAVSPPPAQADPRTTSAAAHLRDDPAQPSAPGHGDRAQGANEPRPHLADQATRPGLRDQGEHAGGHRVAEAFGTRPPAEPYGPPRTAPDGPHKPPAERGPSPDFEAWRQGDSQAQRDETVAVAQARWGGDDPQASAALKLAYEVARDYPAPLLVKVAQDMLTDLRAEVAADLGQQRHTKIVFLGRDGHTLALGVRALDPEFFAAYCTEAVISRAVAEAAVRDRELYSGESFPQLEGFRYRRAEFDPAVIEGAARRLSRYLLEQDIPIKSARAVITIVDTGYRGSVQEMLAAIHPLRSFRGRLAFYGESANDPHPGSKMGYVMQYSKEKNPEPFADDIQYFTMYFVESTLHGRFTSPPLLDETGPVQRLQRFEPDPLSGLNPVRVSERFRDPVTREIAQDVGLTALRHYAERIALMMERDEDWRGELDRGIERYRSQVRSWVLGLGPDPRFAEVADAFVMRDDAQVIRMLAEAVERAQLPPAEATALWRAFDRLPSVEAKREFYERFVG
ncbi:hypothetical protein ACQEUU_21510 [Nonomuraea sp. CA-218870]|uniref:hypothetical protein n=1 Tax=Nonomuraea sp. CA-218870 TaxID=3239998 RepID=UPI003D8BDD0B